MIRIINTGNPEIASFYASPQYWYLPPENNSVEQGNKSSFYYNFNDDVITTQLEIPTGQTIPWTKITYYSEGAIPSLNGFDQLGIGKKTGDLQEIVDYRGGKIISINGFSVNVVPEPANLSLFTLGLLPLLWRSRRQQVKQTSLI